MHLAVLLPLVLLPFSLAKKISVKVGSGGLVFNPSNITAAKGDTVEFTFYPKNHSVAQSTFDKPCQALDKGIFSGFLPTNSVASQIFTVTVNDTNPIWLYCSAPDHCQQGMAMVINEPSDKKLSTYQDNSKAAITSSQSEIEGGVISNQASGSSSSSASTAASKTSASNTAASKTSASATSTSKAAAAGKVNAGAGLGALGLLGFLVGGMV